MDELIVAVIVGVAALYLFRRFTSKKNSSCGCGGCGGCGTQPQQTMEKTDQGGCSCDTQSCQAPSDPPPTSGQTPKEND